VRLVGCVPVLPRLIPHPFCASDHLFPHRSRTPSAICPPLQRRRRPTRSFREHQVKIPHRSQIDWCFSTGLPTLYTRILRIPLPLSLLAIQALPPQGRIHWAWRVHINSRRGRRRLSPIAEGTGKSRRVSLPQPSAPSSGLC